MNFLISSNILVYFIYNTAFFHFDCSSFSSMEGTQVRNNQKIKYAIQNNDIRVVHFTVRVKAKIKQTVHNCRHRKTRSCCLLESGHTISSRENIPLCAESIPGLTLPQRLSMQARSIACRRGGLRSHKLHFQVGKKKKILSSINRWCLREQVHNLIIVGEPVVDQSRHNGD